jgi:hypothetical protein
MKPLANVEVSVFRVGKPVPDIPLISIGRKCPSASNFLKK